jgi:DNA modification methylase
MQIQQMNIGSIKPYENNPRKNDKAVDTVIRSIEEYGFQQPIVVDKNNIIIVGHTRYRAAKKLGLSSVPVLISDTLTEKQVIGYRIMDNRSNENAHWDDKLLIDEIKLLLDQDVLSIVSDNTGFTEAQLNKMFPDSTVDEIVDIGLAEYKSKTGDLWILGDHKLLNGDSTNVQDISRLMDNDKIDLLWEDPPYGVSYETINSINYSKEENDKRNHKIANDNITPEQLDVFLDQHMASLSNYLKPGSPIYWCHDIRYTQQFKNILERHQYHISDTLIWKKNKHSTFLNDYAKYYEPILYGWKQGKQHPWYGTWSPNAKEEDYNNLSKEELIKIIKSIPSNYQEFDREAKNISNLHPTVKPTKLIAYHIINSTKTNEIVFDGFAGSGSTLIASEKTGRKARCIEYEPKFCDVIIRRWQDLTGLQAIRDDGILWDNIDNTSNVDVNNNLEQLLDMEITND